MYTEHKAGCGVCPGGFRGGPSWQCRIHALWHSACLQHESSPSHEVFHQLLYQPCRLARPRHPAGTGTLRKPQPGACGFIPLENQVIIHCQQQSLPAAVSILRTHHSIQYHTTVNGLMLARRACRLVGFCS